MSLKSRLDRIERNLPKDDIKITTNLWDENKEPWPATPEQKKAYEAIRPGVQTIWIERSKGENNE